MSVICPKIESFKINNITTLILAAGIGGRIGMPKWQLAFKGKTFLDIICEKLHTIQLRDIICIKRKEFVIERTLLNYVINPTPENGMIASVYYGVKKYPNYEAYIIWPVDHPFVEISTILKLKKIFVSNPQKVIRPVFNGIAGHPIIIPNSLLSQLQCVNYHGGLRQFIKDSKPEIFDLPVQDINILKNINLIEDLNT